MPTMIFSAPSKYWKSRCTNQLRPETSVNGDQCLACVIPTVVPVEPPPVTCGTASWIVLTVSIPEGPDTYMWVLDENTCTGGGTPVEPTNPPSGPTQTATTDCDCP